jgi:uncharacterized membrane protein YozB (DUF420 family)
VIEQLPTLNAALNTLSACLLVLGWAAIRKGRARRHRNLMVGALVCSVLFLVSYVTYHAIKLHTPFEGEGWIRPVYFVLLITHVALAAAIVPLVIVTVVRAGRGRFERHRRIARLTLPLWLYVNVTGVLIYFMLYHWFT